MLFVELYNTYTTAYTEYPNIKTIGQRINSIQADHFNLWNMIIWIFFHSQSFHNMTWAAKSYSNLRAHFKHLRKGRWWRKFEEAIWHRTMLKGTIASRQSVPSIFTCKSAFVSNWSSTTPHVFPKLTSFHAGPFHSQIGCIVLSPCPNQC